MTPRYRLIVYLKDGPERTAEIDFSDPVLLFAKQLQTFELERTHRRGRPFGKLYEFTNLEGHTLAFTEEYHCSHEVVDLNAAPSVAAT